MTSNYEKEFEKRAKRKPWAWALTAISLLIGIGVMRAVTDVAVPELQRATTSHEDFGRQFDAMVDQPEGIALRALRDHFPNEYAGVRAQFASTAKDRTATAADARRIGFVAMRNFVIAHNANLALAPDRDLQAVATASREFAEALRLADVALCARFGMGTFNVEDDLPESTTSSSTKLSATIIEGIRHGIDTPVDRGDLTDEDVEKFIVAMRKGGVPEDLLQRMDQMDAMSPEDACTTTIGLYRGLETMESASSGRFHAYVVRETKKIAQAQAS